jgi:hypothetical protein
MMISPELDLLIRSSGCDLSRKQRLQHPQHTWDSKVFDTPYWRLMDWQWRQRVKAFPGHPIYLTFTGVVHDIDNPDRIYQKKKWFSRSFTELFSQALNNQINNGSIAVTMTETDSTTQVNPASNAVIFRSDGASGSNLKGLVVGTGVGAEAISNIALGTIVAHGVGAGQLQYGAVSFAAVVTSDPTSYLEFQRVFTANTVSTVNTTETAWYGNIGNSAVIYACFARDLQNFSIPVASALTLTARVTVTNH